MIWSHLLRSEIEGSPASNGRRPGASTFAADAAARRVRQRSSNASVMVRGTGLRGAERRQKKNGARAAPADADGVVAARRDEVHDAEPAGGKWSRRRRRHQGRARRSQGVPRADAIIDRRRLRDGRRGFGSGRARRLQPGRHHGFRCCFAGRPEPRGRPVHVRRAAGRRLVAGRRGPDDCERVSGAGARHGARAQ